MAITVTEAALNKVKEALSQDGNSPTTHVLRMSVVGGGCSGYSYDLAFETAPGPKDKVFEFPLPGSGENDPKLRVVVDQKSYLLLIGVTLDYETKGLTGGFVFRNPNAKSSCGCGTSFNA